MLVSVLVAITALNTFSLLQLRKVVYDLVDLTPDQRIEEVETTEEQFIYGSDEVKEVNRSFEERIEEMKRDLDSKRPTNVGSGNVAPQYHPQVHNLPHDSVTIPTRITHEIAD